MTDHGKTSILVADSESVISNNIMDFLKGIGYKTNYVQSDVNIVDALRDKEYHVLIIDCSQMIAEKIEHIKKVKQSDPSLIILALLSNPKVEQVVELYKSGIDYLFTKPFNYIEFEEVLHNASEQYALNRVCSIFRENREMVIGKLKDLGIDLFDTLEMQTVSGVND